MDQGDDGLIMIDVSFSFIGQTVDGRTRQVKYFALHCGIQYCTVFYIVLQILSNVGHLCVLSLKETLHFVQYTILEKYASFNLMQMKISR